MGLLDGAGKDAVDKLNNTTIPALVAAINALVSRIDTMLDSDIKDIFDQAHKLIDRLNGVSLNIPARS